MRTADKIAEQMEQAGLSSATEIPQNRGKKKGECPPEIAPYRFQPGKSGNPGGRPKQDVAATIARRIFENNEEAVYRALGKSLLTGNAYAYKELAERGYGKLKESLDVSGLDAVAIALAEARKRRKR